MARAGSTCHKKLVKFREKSSWTQFFDRSFMGSLKRKGNQAPSLSWKLLTLAHQVSYQFHFQTSCNPNPTKNGSFSGSGGEHLFGGAPGCTKEICLECPCSGRAGGLGGMAHPGVVVGLLSHVETMQD